MSVVLITGAGRGIGAATARLAAERGHDVCVNFRANEAAAETVVAEMRARGRKAIAVQADVASEAEVVAPRITSGRSPRAPASTQAR